LPEEIRLWYHSAGPCARPFFHHFWRVSVQDIFTGPLFQHLHRKHPEKGGFMLRQFVAACALLLLVPFSASADVERELAADFEPITGVVIMPVGGEFLIDLDAASGIVPGDLFTVIGPGEQIVHPVSGEVLGSLEKTKGVLQVTRVASGYSHARPLAGGADIVRGDTVRRFSDIPAVVPQAEDGATLTGLRQVLPHLTWLSGPGGAERAGESGLTFAQRDGRLVVDSPGYPAFRSYAIVEQAPEAQMPSPVLKQLPAAPKPAAIVRREAAAVEGIWSSPNFQGMITGMEIGDLTGDGRKEIAVLFPHRLEIAAMINGEWNNVAAVELGFGQKALAIDGADLDGNGRMELYITAADERGLQSLVVEFSAGSYQVTQRNIPFYFRAVDLPEEGRILLGQRLGGLRDDFHGPVFRVAAGGGALREGKEIALPRNVSLYGFVPFAARGETLVAALNQFDKLKVFNASGEVLWESEERFGGSEIYFERIDPALNPAAGPNKRYAFLHPRIELGPDGVLLVPFNEGRRTTSHSKNFEKSSVRGMVWTGNSLQESWHTRPQSAYLADFRLADINNDGQAEMVMAQVFLREGIGRKGRSALVVYQMEP
jgi:hypothetical protein